MPRKGITRKHGIKVFLGITVSLISYWFWSMDMLESKAELDLIETYEEIRERLDTLITELEGTNIPSNRLEEAMRKCAVCSKDFVSKNKPSQPVDNYCGSRCASIFSRSTWEEVNKVYNLRREARKQERLVTRRKVSVYGYL